MKTIQTPVYEFNELSDEAKEVACAWFRELKMQDDWWESTYEDARRVGIKITSFDLERGQLVQNVEGDLIESAREVAELIIKEHGDTCDTAKTATAFLAQRDKMVNEAPRDENGDFESEHTLDTDLDELESEFKRDILADYGSMLQREMEYQESEEAITEDILANGYTFTESGKRFG